MSHQQLIIVLLSLFTLLNSLSSQTEISGIINSEISLTLSESPYKIIDDLVIAPDGQISIDPGVELRFLDNTKLEVRGILLALGTSAQNIIFTSDTGTDKGSWIGLDIKNTQAQNVLLNHCNFSNASSAVNEECCWGGSVTIDNCSFINNNTAINGFSGDVTLVKECYFSNNTYCLTNADKRVEDCTFENNTYGLYNTERISVFNSTFINHSQVALLGGRGDLINSIIENNNIGVQTFFEGFTIEDCTISNNTIGIEIGNVDQNYARISNSEICNNDNLNVNNTSTTNIDMYSNCFCTSDQSEIENKINDGDDTNGLGLVSYDIFDDNCEEIISTVNKTLPASNIWTLVNSPYTFTEDYIVKANDTLFIEPGVEVRFASQSGLEVRGTLIAIGTEFESINFTSTGNTNQGSWSGLRIMHSQNANAFFEYCEFEYASTAISEECCWGGMVSILDCKFLSNNTAIGGFSGDITLVKDCFFSNNMFCLTNADKRVEDCTFDNNAYGLFNTERISVFNSTFTNHSEVAISGGRGDLVNSIIEDNNIGVQTFFEGFTTSGTSISNNNIGIEFGFFDQDYAEISNSQICENELFNVRNTSDNNINLYTNCFCEINQENIEEKIFDGDDNNDIGLISYDIFDENCEDLIQKVDKTSPDIFYWTLPNSPYLITEDYVLFPNKTLVIEPGVRVEVGQNINFEIRGSLLIEGTEQDSVYFSSISGTQRGSWQGIQILNTLGGNANIQYCNFKYADTAINEECCWGGNVMIKHCSFEENNIGLGGFSGDISTIDSSYFLNNTYGATNADKFFSNCLFESNEYGLFRTERIDLDNCQFYNHIECALYGGRGLVDNCEINNNKIGVKSFFEGFEIQNSIINENEIGIELNEFNDFISRVENNDICFNSDFNVYNNTDNNASLITNCWCDSDSTAVENLLFDGWDDTVAGLLDYTLFTDDCVTPIFQTDKVNNVIIYFNTVSTNQKLDSEIDVSIFPNPVSEYFVVDIDSPIVSLSLWDMKGVKVSQYNPESTTEKIYINSDLSGLYFLKIDFDDNQSITKRIMILD